MPPLSLLLPLIVHQLLHAVLPALALAAVVMAAGVLLGGVKQAPSAAALGLGAGAALGLWLSDAMELVPGNPTWNRLPWAALAALWVGHIARLPELQPAAGWLLRAAAAIVIAWVGIPSSMRAEFDWLAPVVAAVIFAHWAILERLAADPPDGSIPLCLALVFLTAGAVLIHAGSARLMDVAVVLASALTGLALVAWWRRADAGGAVPAVAVALPLLMLMGQRETFSEIPWYGFALPALAPLLLAEALPLSSWHGPRPQLTRLLVILLLLAVPLGVAFYLAQAAGPLDLGGE
jgi:hypothetical protein